MVAASPAPRFYIYPQNALFQYSSYRKGLSRIHNEETRRMYAEIFVRYERLLAIVKASGQTVNKHNIMQSVLEQTAPSFYYNPISAIKTYYRFKAKLRQHRR